MWWSIPVSIGLVLLFIVFPVAYEYYYEWKEEKNGHSGTGKKDD